MENVPASKGDHGYFEFGGVSLYFSLEVRNSINDLFGYRTYRPPPLVRQVFRLRFTGLLFVVCCSLGCLWGWMKAMIFYGAKAGTRDTLLGRIVDTQTKSGPVSGG